MISIERCLLFDTSGVIGYWKGIPAAVEQVKKSVACFLPQTALGELYNGVYKCQNPIKEEEKVECLLKLAQILYPSKTTAKYYGKILAKLEKQGHRIPSNDIWIAAIALEYDLKLLTRDIHFERVEGIKVLMIETS